MLQKLPDIDSNFNGIRLTVLDSKLRYYGADHTYNIISHVSIRYELRERL